MNKKQKYKIYYRYSRIYKQILQLEFCNIRMFLLEPPLKADKNCYGVTYFEQLKKDKFTADVYINPKKIKSERLLKRTILHELLHIRMKNDFKHINSKKEEYFILCLENLI